MARPDNEHDGTRDPQSANLRQGCTCRCCDHSEGSDCGCDCHANGKCSSALPPVQEIGHIKKDDEKEASRVDHTQYDQPLATAGLRNEVVPTRALAEAIAREAHAGQTEPYGRCRDYIEHVEAVVALVTTDDEKAVAWLHDVIEDTEVDVPEMVERGIPARLARSVARLSRTDWDQSYHDYIADIWASGDAVAIAVKVADLREHLHPSCPDRLRPRYEKALRLLTDEWSIEDYQADAAMNTTHGDGTTTYGDSAGSGVGGTLDGRTRDPHSDPSLSPRSPVQEATQLSALSQQWREAAKENREPPEYDDAESAERDADYMLGRLVADVLDTCADQLDAALAALKETAATTMPTTTVHFFKCIRHGQFAATCGESCASATASCLECHAAMEQWNNVTNKDRRLGPPDYPRLLRCVCRTAPAGRNPFA
jgi:hypothetical protein